MRKLMAVGDIYEGIDGQWEIFMKELMGSGRYL